MLIKSTSSKITESIIKHEDREILSVDDFLNNQFEILSLKNKPNLQKGEIRGMSSILPVYIIGEVGNPSTENDISLALLNINRLKSYEKYFDIVDKIFNNLEYDMPSFDMWGYTDMVVKFKNNLFDSKYDIQS